jgi:hypothetical protein
MRKFSHILSATVILAAGASLTTVRGTAATIVFGSLDASLDSGSLAGVDFQATFSYDAALIDPSEVSYINLNSFDFTLLGTAFTLKDINQGGQVIFDHGILSNITASFQGVLPPGAPVHNITFGFGGPGVIGYIDLAGIFGGGSFRFPPSCVISRILEGPPKQLEVMVQALTGLGAIQVVESSNVTFTLPSFAFGTTIPIPVIATKVDQSQTSTFTLLVNDITYGNPVTCDPVDLTLKLEGREEIHVFRAFKPSEHYIRILNGNPGVTRIRFRVNGRSFEINGLRDEESVVLDLEFAMLTSSPARFTRMRGPSDNIMEISADGAPGDSASILIGDSSVAGGNNQAP